MMCRIGRMTGDLLLLVQKNNQTKFKKLFLNFKQSKLIRFLSNCSKPCPLQLELFKNQGDHSWDLTVRKWRINYDSFSCLKLILNWCYGVGLWLDNTNWVGLWLDITNWAWFSLVGSNTAFRRCISKSRDIFCLFLSS